MNRVLIPVDSDLTVEQVTHMTLALERLLPDHMVIVVGGMRGSAIEIATAADYVQPTDR